MSTNILMPALSPTMTEGTLSRWLKKEGEEVKAGDVVAEIETDKATMEVEAVDEGVIGKLIVPEGTTGVQVNAPIAVLLAEGETMADAPAAAAPAPAAPAPAAAEPPKPAPSAPSPKAEPPAPPATSPAPVPVNGNARERIFASPLARRMAGQAGLDLSAIKGTGPRGRIVKVDVEAALAERAPGAGKAVAPPPAPSAGAPAAAEAPPEITIPHRLVPLTTMRRVIAHRLSEGQRDMPHYFLSVDLAVDALLKLRADLNARSPKEDSGAFKLSVNDFIIKAAAIALTRVPQVNASWSEAGIIEYEDVDISVAVAIPEGLITPIIRHADRKGLAAISNEMKDLAQRAKDGKLKLEEFSGGGFSISNLGMYGIREFTAVINPPQSAILAVGAAEKRAVVKDGELGIATMMTCTITADHRVIDGALGAVWLREFKAIIEDPLSLML